MAHGHRRRERGRRERRKKRLHWSLIIHAHSHSHSHSVLALVLALVVEGLRLGVSERKVGVRRKKKRSSVFGAFWGDGSEALVWVLLVVEGAIALRVR